MNISSALDGIGKTWNQFWFRPLDPLCLAILRWLAGGMLFYTHFVWSLRFDDFFGPDSWQTVELIREIQRDTWAASFWWLVPEPWQWTFHCLCLVILFAFWIGLATRITGVLTFVIAVSYANRLPLAMYGLDQINVLTAMYLAIAPCGMRLSADRWLERWFHQRWPQRYSIAEVVPLPSTRLATRLIQVHLCIIYLWAGLGKVQGTTWWTGEAMWLSAASLEYQSNDLTWIIHLPWLAQFITIATWAWEISFCGLIWNHRLRPWVLLVGLGMHWGIGMFMGMWTFAFSMMFLYVAFVEPETVTGLYGRWYSLALGAGQQQGLPQPLQVGSTESMDKPLQQPLRNRELTVAGKEVEEGSTILLMSGQPHVQADGIVYLSRHRLRVLVADGWPEMLKMVNEFEPDGVLIFGNQHSISELEFWFHELEQRLPVHAASPVLCIKQQQLSEAEKRWSSPLPKVVLLPATWKSIRLALTGEEVITEEKLEENLLERVDEREVVEVA